MRSLITIILALSCVVMFIIGNTYWDKRTAASTSSSNSKVEENVTPIKSTTNTNASTEEKSKIVKEDAKGSSLLTLTKNWPSQASEQFNKKLTAGQPFHILIVGSEAIGTSKDGWAHLLEEKLLTTYGNDHMQVSIQPFDMNSTKFISSNTYLNVVKQKADLVLFEPFTLNDNGFVPTSNSLANISTFLKAYKSANPNGTTILLPPHPIYKAKYYPIQVADLEAYAKKNGIPYLNHWTVWPSSTSTKINSYLTVDQSAPNTNGAKLIADYLTRYFIAE